MRSICYLFVCMSSMVGVQSESRSIIGIITDYSDTKVIHSDVMHEECNLTILLKLRIRT